MNTKQNSRVLMRMIDGKRIMVQILKDMIFYHKIPWPAQPSGFFYAHILKVLLRVCCREMNWGSKKEKAGDLRKSRTKLKWSVLPHLGHSSSGQPLSDCWILPSGLSNTDPTLTLQAQAWCSSLLAPHCFTIPVWFLFIQLCSMTPGNVWSVSCPTLTSPGESIPLGFDVGWISAKYCTVLWGGLSASTIRWTQRSN